MPTTISVFEGGSVEITSARDTERTKLRLLGTTLGNRPAFSIRRGKLYAGDLVGAIDAGSVRVEILPKPYGVTEIPQARALLFAILRWAGFEARVAWLPGASAVTDDDIVDIVEHHAISELLRRLEQGVPLRYQTVEELSLVVRGRINFSRYVRQLPTHSHQIPIRHNPRSADNNLGRLLKALTAFLQSRAKSHRSRLALERCLATLDGVASRPLSRELVQTVRLGRLEHEWRRLVNLAEILASGASPDPSGLGEGHQPTLLFPLNHLFELVVGRVLSKRLPRPLSCTRSTGEFRLLTHPETSSSALSVKPDLVFQNGSAFVAVGDAKWKALVASDPRYGLSPNDVYQVLTYMRRLGVRQGVMFYPRTGWMPEDWTATFEIEPGQTERICIVPVDVASVLDKEASVRDAAQNRLAKTVQVALAA